MNDQTNRRGKNLSDKEAHKLLEGAE